jgi:hypothetical protein
MMNMKMVPKIDIPAQNEHPVRRWDSPRARRLVAGRQASRAAHHARRVPPGALSDRAGRQGEAQVHSPTTLHILSRCPSSATGRRTGSGRPPGKRAGGTSSAGWRLLAAVSSAGPLDAQSCGLPLPQPAIWRAVGSVANRPRHTFCVSSPAHPTRALSAQTVSVLGLLLSLFLVLPQSEGRMLQAFNQRYGGHANNPACAGWRVARPASPPHANNPACAGWRGGSP